MDSLLFPDDALEALRSAVWKLDAERAYDGMSDSFMWSDESWEEVISVCGEHKNWSFRFLLAYRGMVIRGEADGLESLQPLWNQVARECPQWPGLRPERNSPLLANDLRRASRRLCAQFARVEQELRKTSSDTVE